MRTIKTTLLLVIIPFFSWADQSVNASKFISGIGKLVKKDRVVYQGQSAGKNCKIEILNSPEEVTFFGEIEGELIAFVNVTKKSNTERATFGDKLILGNFSRFDKTAQKKFNEAIVVSREKNKINMIRVQMTVLGAEQQVTCWIK
ncbi:hypothetical protein D3C87_1163680 [compost metagenome]